MQRGNFTAHHVYETNKVYPIEFQHKFLYFRMSPHLRRQQQQQQLPNYPD